MAVDSFPRQYARTRRLTLGEPRTFTVSPDGRRVVFLRSRSGSDPVNCLWRLDVATGEEHLIADPLTLLASDDAELPIEERRRRERAREQASGVVSYATDAAVTVLAFALAGRLFVGGILTAQARELAVTGPVYDPRPDPSARRVAYVRGSDLCIAELDGSDTVLCHDDADTVSWGQAEFVAAEEMGRQRGYWWAPDGQHLAVARVDTAPVRTWWIADPAQPEQSPTAHRYPQAGSANAEVRLFVVALDGSRIEVNWDREQFPYLADVRWSGGPLTITVQSRDQRCVQIARVDPATGGCELVAQDTDPTWVELVAGVPAWLGDGRLVTAGDRDGARRLLVDGEAVTPPQLQVRSVVSVDTTGVVLLANELADATSQHVYRWDGASTASIDDAPGVHSAASGGGTIVRRRSSLESSAVSFEVIGGPTIATYAEQPLVEARPRLLALGTRRLNAALLVPSNVADGASLPVLLDPYGGPHSQRVVASRTAFAASQWLADQGFAVIVIDGRGTPGRGSDWERAVHLDLAEPVLEDQIDGLMAVAELEPRLDLNRVAIRGWSFGGYLAALAVLRRPDVFHAAIAGAPVTDWRLYDTHYTERYLGDPSVDADPYERTSLLNEADRLTRPLMLIHGLADDNVVAAHTLQLSSALLAAGRQHTVLPLAGVTHMTPQEVVAENLLLLQVDFLRSALGVAPPPELTA